MRGNESETVGRAGAGGQKEGVRPQAEMRLGFVEGVRSKAE